MKKENEITVKLNCSYHELTNILQSKGFSIINEVTLIDIYLIKKDIDILNTSNQEIMSDYLIVRIPNNDNPQITYKYKKYNEDGSIKEQSKINCNVVNENEALELLENIGYKKLFVINNEIKFYKKDDIHFTAALVNDEYLCLEYNGTNNQTIDEMIKDFEANYSYIPYDSSNYFINKAIIELNKIKNSVI